MATWAQVGQELKSIFPYIGTRPEFYYYCKIGETLSTPAQVEIGCAELEKAMTDIIRNRYLQQDLVENKGIFEFPYSQYTETSAIVNSFNTRGEAFKNSYPAKPGHYQKLYSKCLSTALAAEEATGGFNGVVGYIYGAVSAPAFFDLLRHKRVFKDVGASVLHGEFTHRIQWYVLSRLLFNRSLDERAPRASDVYASLAEWSKPLDTIKAQENPCGGKCTSVWDALCDRGTEFKACLLDNDFRSPVNFFRWLRKGEGSKQFPVLSAFLQSRFVKRSGGDYDKGASDSEDVRVQAVIMKLLKQIEGDDIARKKAKALKDAGFVTQAHLNLAKSQISFARSLDQAKKTLAPKVVLYTGHSAESGVD